MFLQERHMHIIKFKKTDVPSKWKVYGFPKYGILGLGLRETKIGREVNLKTRSTFYLPRTSQVAVVRL